MRAAPPRPARRGGEEGGVETGEGGRGALAIERAGAALRSGAGARGPPPSSGGCEIHANLAVRNNARSTASLPHRPDPAWRTGTRARPAGATRRERKKAPLPGARWVRPGASRRPASRIAVARGSGGAQLIAKSVWSGTDRRTRLKSHRTRVLSAAAGAATPRRDRALLPRAATDGARTALAIDLVGICAAAQSPPDRELDCPRFLEVARRDDAPRRLLF